MRHQNAFGLATTLAVLMTTTAMAQQSSNENAGPVDLGTLVITGAATPGNIADLPADVDVLSGEEKRRRQSGSLGATLKHLSGVASTSSSSAFGTCQPWIPLSPIGSRWCAVRRACSMAPARLVAR